MLKAVYQVNINKVNLDSKEKLFHIIPIWVRHSSPFLHKGRISFIQTIKVLPRSPPCLTASQPKLSPRKIPLLLVTKKFLDQDNKVEMLDLAIALRRGYLSNIGLHFTVHVNWLSGIFGCFILLQTFCLSFEKLGLDFVFKLYQQKQRNLK